MVSLLQCILNAHIYVWLMVTVTEIFWNYCRYQGVANEAKYLYWLLSHTNYKESFYEIIFIRHTNQVSHLSQINWAHNLITYIVTPITSCPSPLSLVRDYIFVSKDILIFTNFWLQHMRVATTLWLDQIILLY